MQDDIHGGYSQIQVTEGIEYWKQSISQSIHNFQESIINNQLINQWFILQGNRNSFPSLGV